MPNKREIDNFYIDNFEPIHLKKARALLEKHLQAVELHAQTNETYKKGILKKSNFWDKVKHILHLD